MDTYSFVDITVLELNESGADGSDVRLLVAEGHAAGALRILQFRININSGVAHASVETIHDQSQFNCAPKQPIQKKEKQSINQSINHQIHRFQS